MAQEIEEYLFSQFCSGLDGKDKIPLYSHFTEIRASLEDIFKSSSPVLTLIREKLYYLNNVLTECQMLSRTDLGVEEEIIKSALDIGLKGLLYALHLQLVGKRYLIVFDDARDEDDKESWFGQLNSSFTGDGEWNGDRLAYGLPKGCGGTVLVTSRNEEVAKKMVGQENIHRLLPLSDPESCWLIFKESAEQGGRPFNPSNAQDLKKEILEKCAGLPFTAKMMGQIMCKQLRDEAPASPNQTQQQEQQPTTA